ncbi:hypothetical protein [Streptomyces sp. NRRL F-5135]|uniref:Rv1733c family protein n=1 Tax=Streptomyces sp. NRRL F-5135 TaxID=1463858 RepID=UPI00131D58EA|nr:hypothetical protein [Streptomyces sp. NRRL F-5135]
MRLPHPYQHPRPRPHHRAGRLGKLSPYGRRANPLLRLSDWLRIWVDLLIAAALVIGVPAAGWAAGAATYDHYQAVARSRSADRHQVTAVLTGDAGGSAPIAGPGVALAGAPVRWTAADGTHHGTAAVAAGLRKGRQVRIWVDDRTEKVVTPPSSPGPAVTLFSGVATGVTAAGGAVGLAACVRAAVRRSLDHRDCARWEKEWARVEPHWTHRA